MKELGGGKAKTKTSKKVPYRKYTYDKRKKLIQAVQGKNQPKKSLTAVAKELGICQTTARLIMATWINYGRIFETKASHQRRLKKEAQRKALRLRFARLSRRTNKKKLEQEEAEQILENINNVKIEENKEQSRPLPNMELQNMQNRQDVADFHLTPLPKMEISTEEPFCLLVPPVACFNQLILLTQPCFLLWN